jgi:elongation factor P hydroxylase
MTDPHAQRISAVFNALFADTHRTLMCGGGEEPWYEPPTDQRLGRVVYTRDYPASALHEAAHWCLAGAKRRAQKDYGYWYLPGPRDAQQRSRFFAAELPVQALEAVFAAAAGVRFVISADDFAAPACELDAFAARVRQRIATLTTASLPPRARAFHAALVLHRDAADACG